ncbi:MAG: hypothetical protein V1915_02085 [Candidatus Bathyarchaeota archaeon]
MDEALLKKVNKLKSFEIKNANSLKTLLEINTNSVVNMFLGGIMLDSTKHANILQAIMDVDAGQVLWDIDKQRMKTELKEHLEIENQMLQSIQDILGENRNKRIEPLLKGILIDERRHHRILTQLLATIDNMNVMKEEWANLFVQFQQEDFGRT